MSELVEKLEEGVERDEMLQGDEHVIELSRDQLYMLARGMSSFKRKSNKKIGRNDPCPCGSGKKYKKCCLHIYRTDMAQPLSNENRVDACACHEAGHVVMASIFSVPVEYCTVDSSGKGYSHSLTGDYYNENPTPQRAAVNALINMAGPVFEALVCDSGSDEIIAAGAGDQGQAEIAVSKAIGSTQLKCIRNALALVMNEARKLLRRCQNILNTVADLLIVKGRLEECEINAFAQASQEIAEMRSDLSDGTWLDDFVAGLRQETGEACI